MTKTLKLVFLGCALFCVGIVIGVVSRMPEKQETYTPITSSGSLLQYRFPNNRGLFVDVQTYSDASAKFEVTPVRYCEEGSRRSLWQDDGPPVTLRSGADVQNLLKRRSMLGPPECVKP